jgi:hypothetical protein
MNDRLNRYVEITSRIKCGRRFCEFLESGGTVWDQPAGSSWRNVTAEAMEKERRTVERLERVRSQLYPDLVVKEVTPLYSH